jgi:hypothetical protein
MNSLLFFLAYTNTIMLLFIYLITKTDKELELKRNETLQAIEAEILKYKN